MKYFITSLFLLLWMAMAPLPALAEIRIAVASNFIQPMSQIVQLFEQQTGSRVIVSSGSSGKLYAQIRHGAPFDVFFSADQDKPARLVKEGLALAHNRFTYALGRLVLWSADDGLFQSGNNPLEQLKFQRLALANPRLAPYGMAAEQTLRHLQLVAATKPRWVMGENIAQTYQFVSTGNAELGFVALSQVTQNGTVKQGAHWIVPEQFHKPIAQDAVLLQGASPAARDFFHFVQSQPMQRLIKSFGYQTADIKDAID